MRGAAGFALSLPARRRLRRALLAGIAVLYVISIPWYRRASDDTPLVLGLPEWVAVALACYTVAALLNAIAWLLTDVPDGEPDGDDSR